MSACSSVFTNTCRLASPVSESWRAWWVRRASAASRSSAIAARLAATSATDWSPGVAKRALAKRKRTVPRTSPLLSTISRDQPASRILGRRVLASRGSLDTIVSCVPGAPFTEIVHKALACSCTRSVIEPQHRIDRCARRNTPQHLALGGQQQLGPLAFGDVTRVHHDRVHGRVGCQVGCDAFEVAVGAVGVAAAIFDRHRPAARFELLGDLRDHRREVVGVDELRDVRCRPSRRGRSQVRGPPRSCRGCGRRDRSSSRCRPSPARGPGTTPRAGPALRRDARAQRCVRTTLHLGRAVPWPGTSP